MLQLAEYTLIETLHEGNETVIHRAVRTRDRLQVIIKSPRSEYPAPRVLARLQHEHALLAALDLPGVVRVHALERSGSSLALVEEDFGGQPLDRLMRGGRLDLATALQIATAVADTLAALHDLPLVYKDIKPHHVLVHLPSMHVRLIDFSLATRLSQEAQQVERPGALAGTLAYMSPEQTGRMNRVVDPRSDLYSLGVTLYELLTGSLPFQTSDAMEMILCHVARRPVPPHERDPAIPRPLSDVVMKLLAKAAEDRYQSARGLVADLHECARQWRERGEIAAFPLGRTDRDGALRLPQRLYGREDEVAALLAAYERVGRGGVELLLLSGYAGVGKSTLVQELDRSIAQRDAHFIRGKFDQLSRHIPYAPVAHAFRQLLRELLAEPPEGLEAWRRDLFAALGGNAQLLIGLLPELGLITGPLPELPELGPTEAKNRFTLVLQRFVRVFASAARPLVLFLDDLQWADPASLKLLQVLLGDPDACHLLIIGAYREHEVDAAHPLRTLLAELRRAGAVVHELVLQPLALVHVVALLADALASEPPRVAPLAQLVWDKTQGNPFFLGQFLAALHRERLLHFDAQASVWCWDLEAIARAQVTSNVVEFMASKLRRLLPEAQRLLMLAACVGHEFELGALAALDEHSPAATAGKLWEAVREGLIVPVGGDYRFLVGGSTHDAELLARAAGPALEVRFRFLHDRVQQAAASLLTAHERQRLHLRIGRRLQSRAGQGDEQLFETVHHLNAAATLITDPDERLALARLDLAAARRAKAGTAYVTAAGHCRAGIALLGDDAWDAAHALSFDLHAECAECEYLAGQPAEAEALFDVLLARAGSTSERVHVHGLRIVLYTTLGRFTGAIAAGRAGLALLGVDLPEDEPARQAAVAATLAEIEATRGDRSIAALADAPALTDPTQHAIVHLLMELVAPAFFTSPTLFTLLITRMVAIAQRHGNSALSAYGYLAYGYVLAAGMGRPAEALEFGRLGLAVHEQRYSAALACRVQFVFGSYLHLCQPLRAALTYLARAVSSGLETGDLTYVSFAFNHTAFTLLGLGDELTAVGEEVDRFLALMKRTQDAASLRTLTIARQVIAALTGRTRHPHTLDDDRFDGQVFLADCEAAGFAMVRCYYHFTRLQLLYLHGDAAGALAAAKEAEALHWSALGMYFRTELPLYGVLARAALWPSADAGARAELVAAMEQHHAQLYVYAEGCPDNYAHQKLLTAAELARVSGREVEAVGLYEQAIAAAQEAGFIHHVAIASERCASLHEARRRRALAGFYLREAYYGYQRWGATVKTEALARQHPSLTGELRQLVAPPLTTTTAPGEAFDVAALLRASQTIAGEMVLGNVVTTLLRGVLTSAGAQRGFLLVPRGGGLALEAAADTESDRVEVGLGQPLGPDAPLAAAVAHFVARTRETVILGDAAADPRFAGDPYVARARPRSVLCLALLHQARLTGVLYLENNAATDAFSAGRAELLRLLSSQAATAMENARLYADVQRANEALEREVGERTDELRAVAARLRAANESLSLRGGELHRANERLQAELVERQRAERERAALQQAALAAQQERLAELSTPLIPLTDQIMVMPLIGTVDAARAQQVLETALEGAQRSRARVVILDITGMRRIDAGVADTLLATARALGLLGAHTVLTGVRPEVAQLLVGLGADLRSLVTRGTLQSGIAYALGRTRGAAAWAAR